MCVEKHTPIYMINEDGDVVDITAGLSTMFPQRPPTLNHGRKFKSFTITDLRTKKKSVVNY